MTHNERDEAAGAAFARAIRKAWPMKGMDKAAAGWSNVVLVALRADPEGRAAIVAALLDEAMLSRALAGPGVFERPVDDAHGLARRILAALAPPRGR